MEWIPLAQSELLTDRSWHRSLDWPWWLVVLLLLAMVLWIALNWRSAQAESRSRLWVLLSVCRMSALTGLLFAMMGWYQRSVEIEPPEIAICLDLSQSMAQQSEATGGTEPGARSRLAVLREPFLDESYRTTLAQHWKVRWFGLGASLRELNATDMERLQDLESLDSASRLGEDLAQLLDETVGRPLAGVVFLSDGINTEGRDLKQFDRRLKQRKIPFYSVAIGTDAPPQDVRLDAIQVPSQALVGETVIFRVPVEASQLAGKTVLVTLRDREAQRELASETWTPDSAQASTELEFVQKITRPGPQSFLFEVAVDGTDLDATNNQQVVQVQATQLQHRILIVAGHPHYEYRFLKHTIERSIRDVGQASLAPFDLKIFLQSAVPAFSETDANAVDVFPVSLDELAAYDVVVLIDPLAIQEDQARGLSERDLENLAQFVERRAGNLVMVAGPQFDPRRWTGSALERLLPGLGDDFQTWSIPPGTQQSFAVTRSPLGEMTSPLQLEDVTSSRPFDWQDGWAIERFLGPLRLRPGTRVLLHSTERVDAEGQPVSMLTLRTVGAGAVLFQGFAESYRLRYRRNDEVFNAYWSQWIQYLAKRKWLSQRAWRDLSTDKLRYRVGEPVRIRAVMSDSRQANGGPEVQVWSREGFATRVVLTPGEQGPLEFVTELNGLAEGDYSVSVRSSEDAQPLESRFEIQGRRREEDVVAIDRDALQHLAQVSGGRVLSLSELRQLPKWLPAGKPLVVGRRPDQPLWDRERVAALVGGLVIGLLGLEWILRNRLA